MAPRILIVKLSSLGDVLHTLPAGQLLRQAFPGSHLGWAVERAHAGVLAGQPWLDEAIVWDRGGKGGGWRFLRQLRSGGWDVAVDFQGLLRSALVARGSGAKQVFGHAPTKERAHWFYHARIPLPTMDRHAVERSLDLAHSVAVRLDAAVPPRDQAPSACVLYPSAADREAVEGWRKSHGLRDGEQLVLLNPHCRKEANRWPLERFSQLAERLLRDGVRVALVGGSVAREVCDAIAGPLGGRVMRADGTFGLLASAELIRLAAVFVTGDTGPMHIAAAVGTPIVALFGPANPLRTGPYTSRAEVIHKRLPCSPCYARERCPLGHVVPACMAEIRVDEVYAAIGRQLASNLRRSA